MLRRVFEKENKLYPRYIEIYEKITKGKTFYNCEMTNVCCLYLIKKNIENDIDLSTEYDISINTIMRDFPQIG
jgi:hypothetical protein